MLTNTGADGVGQYSSSSTAKAQLTHVDIDWEYPGGNGADYKQVPNSAKAYQVDAYPKALAAIRSAIGPNKLLSIAVPGKKGGYDLGLFPIAADKNRRHDRLQFGHRP